MALDFAKLRDPAWQAKMRQAREAEEDKREALEKSLQDAARVCLVAIDALSAAERSLVRNCRTLLGTHLMPSEKQQKWLLDIAARLQKQEPRS